MIRAIPLFFIRLYQAYSSTREPRCKFYPSCSNYAAVAIRRHGLKGLFMAVRRIARCHPWTLGGVDYVDADLDSSEARDRAQKDSTEARDRALNNSFTASSLKEGVR